MIRGGSASLATVPDEKQNDEQKAREVEEGGLENNMALDYLSCVLCWFGACDGDGAGTRRRTMVSRTYGNSCPVGDVAKKEILCRWFVANL
jgi:hypothetical protein